MQQGGAALHLSGSELHQAARALHIRASICVCVCAPVFLHVAVYLCICVRLCTCKETFIYPLISRRVRRHSDAILSHWYAELGP